MKKKKRISGNRLATAIAAGALLALPMQSLAVPDGKLTTGGGTVGIPDVIKALRVAIKLDSPTADILTHGDVAPLNMGYPNPDGEIKLGDVIVILKKAVGILDWPIGDQALKVASKVSVVDAKNAGVQQLALKVAPMAVGTADQLPAGSDYKLDPTFSYVQDRSTDAFKTVNEILCMTAQTRYDAMLNRGPYKVLIDSNLCSGNDSAANAGQSQQAGTSATNAPDYQNWTVKAVRDSNTAPQIVTAWVHEPARSDGGGYSEPEKVIQAKITITESSSDTNPYGIFSMDFIAYPVINGQPASTPVFKGILKAEKDPTTGKVLLKFADADINQSRKEAVTLEKNLDGTGGGTAYQYESFDQQTKEGTIDFAYTSSLFHRQDQGVVGIEACLDRNTFETSAWSYGLYDSTTGNRINVDSGFPIKYIANDTTSFGWIGYWGLWLPNNIDIPNGATVYKQAFGPNATETPYTVMKVQGKLKKHVRNDTTLDAIKNLPLEGYWETDPNTMQTLNYRVVWNGTKLQKVASAPQNTMGAPVWTELNPPVDIDFTNLQWGELNFWSQALGGQVRIPLANCQFTPPPMGQIGPGITSCDAPAGATPVAYYVESTILPGDTVPATLACYDNCPQAGSTGMDPLGNLTYPMSTDPNGNNRHDYAFGADMTLKDKGPQGDLSNPAILTTAPQNQQWGFNSGPLFDPTSTNMARLACDWDPNQTCGWKAWSALDEFYTWETGPNNWNQLAVLTGANGALRFEQPKRVAYVHSQTDATKPDAKYDGVTFSLDYNGFGQLNGIPGKCVDMNSGLTVLDCSGQNVRWVPEFTIPAGRAVTENDPVNGTVTYFVKPLQMEQRMVKLDNTSCAGLPLTTYTLPVIGQDGTIEGWTDPAIGTEPQVTSAPAVIAGTLQ
ncbi:hypothetical protein [Geobacter sp.]|uniref:hypothetical protein n=1 Tax=Geobacter sp. TaxID=46610 RepID=UPI002611334C|nr:hypothetical protein [Geobacter sp.]